MVRFFASCRPPVAVCARGAHVGAGEVSFRMVLRYLGTWRLELVASGCNKLDMRFVRWRIIKISHYK